MLCQRLWCLAVCQFSSFGMYIHLTCQGPNSEGKHVIMYVESFKTDAIVFIGKVINEFNIALTVNFQYESRFPDNGNVTL